MLFGHKKSENNNHTIEGNSVRNELRTGVILAEDINILIKFGLANLDCSDFTLTMKVIIPNTD